jgi:glycosyltransferase involved in cell wall biosynthesis
MRIGIDISQIVYGTGVSVYTRKLVKGLLEIDREDSYTLFAGTLRRKIDVINIFPQARVLPFPPAVADFIWNKLHILPVEKLIGEVDVFHSSDWTQPPTMAFKVTTVHDLIPLKFPKMIHPQILRVHKKRLELVKKEADRIIVPSDSAMADLMAYGVDQERIRKIPEANNIVQSDPEKVELVKRKHQIAGEYLLAFGSSFYKNIERVIKAFELASPGKDLKLVVIGRQSNTDIKETRNVRLTGFVSAEEYSALCTGAKALIYPSLYEGYGIAILDAFACGTPVVTSNVSSMPEVAGEAAVLVDPYDVNSIADGIIKALKSPKSLIEKGSRRLSNFSWQETAKMTLAVYKESQILK